MLRKIVDLILEYAFKMQFISEAEQPATRLELYKKAEKLYQSDPLSFSKESLKLLHDKVTLLETDQYESKMECAQIWHKNSFDIWVFRIRYYLNIEPETNTKLLEQKIKLAFSNKGQSFIEAHDARRAYERLFFQALQSNESEDQGLRSSLEKILSHELVRDVDGVVAYVSINNHGKSKKTIPSYMKTIYLAVTSLAVIEGNGLCGWLVENNLRSLRDIANALKKIGLVEAAAILQGLYDILKNNSSFVQQDEICDQHIINQIENTEKQLFNSYTTEELMTAAQRFLSKNNH